jgi:hypothetical protein
MPHREPLPEWHHSVATRDVDADQLTDARHIDAAERRVRHRDVGRRSRDLRGDVTRLQQTCAARVLNRRMLIPIDTLHFRD